MKKLLIGALVAAILLQIWQTVSWTFANVHAAEVQYTAEQDKILAVLSESLKDGEYFLPTVPPGTSAEDQQKLMEQAVGKPWATINYHSAYEINMGANMLRGFVVNFVSAIFLCWILLKFSDLNFSNAIMSSLFVGLIGYFTIVYMHHIWFEESTIGYLIDVIVSWGLVGAWLGFYLPDKKAA